MPLLAPSAHIPDEALAFWSASCQGFDGCAGQTPAQSPQYRRIRLAAPMQSRPAAVPRLWQGPSPFEYRGLETESFEETPRGSPSAAPEQAQHAQQPAQDRSVPQIPSKAPPLLKRNVEKAATAQQAKHTPAAMQPKKVGPACSHLV